MAINDAPYTADLLALYKKMNSNPMTIEDYAAELASITDTQILTAEAKMGIPVSTQGSASAQTGQTTANGEII